MRRLRPTDALPDTADRVAGLLARAPGGWVPPAQLHAPVAGGDDALVDLAPAFAVPAALRASGGPEALVHEAPDVTAGATAALRTGSQPESLPQEASDPPVQLPTGRKALPSWRSALPASLSEARVDLSRGAVLGLLAVGLVAAVIAGSFMLRGRPQPVDAPQITSAGTPLVATGSAGPAPRVSPVASGPPTAASGEVVVAVAGKVRRPGLVHLPTGSRVDDAVRAAGGALPGIDLGVLNLARRLVDGEQVLVGIAPAPGAAPGPAAAPDPSGQPPAAGKAPAGPVDLNTATAADLDALPGIGPVLAQRIVDWRTEHGRFASVEQLREVTGIGEAKFRDLQSAVTTS